MISLFLVTAPGIRDLSPALNRLDKFTTNMQRELETFVGWIIPSWHEDMMRNFTFFSGGGVKICYISSVGKQAGHGRCHDSS